MGESEQKGGLVPGNPLICMGETAEISESVPKTRTDIWAKKGKNAN